LIEISKLRTGCELFESAQQGRTREGLALGAMSRVLTGGMIAVGDEVRLA
jgi:MOSC domain-containing protein YiiM